MTINILFSKAVERRHFSCENYDHVIYHCPYTGRFDAKAMRRALVKRFNKPDGKQLIGVIDKIDDETMSIEFLYKAFLVEGYRSGGMPYVRISYNGIRGLEIWR